MTGETVKREFERRDFMKLMGAGAAVSALPGAAKSARAGEADSRGVGSTTRSSAKIVHSRLVTEHTLDADVVVVGGGMAGVCASLAAARNGSSVVLVQDRSVLGGNASSEVRMHIVGADTHHQNEKGEARESGILEELRLEESVRNPQRCANIFDIILYEWVKREPNITLLLDTHCYGVEMASEDRLAAVLASRHSTEDLYCIRAGLFLDCSGDGRLGAEAGAMYRMGREGRNEFGESMAPPEPDNKTLGSSILFLTREYDEPMPFIPPGFIRKFPSCSDLPHRGHGGWEYGYWWVEWGGELDIIKDNERIREELLAVAMGVWDHIKNSGQHPRSENWALEWVGAIPGKRESRRFVGDHILKQPECERGEVFGDAVAYGGWTMDLHPPKGIYEPAGPFTTKNVPLYSIPLRSLYSRNISNLLFAGRQVSSSHVAFGSTRVMATCSVMGQAVGTAAALCARHGCTPRELCRESITELQQLLLRDDAYLIGASNSDSYDLARKADVRASSEAPGGQAALVTNGVTRRTPTADNCWVSDPEQGLPQWIELRFPEPKRIREIHLTFDSGLKRLLKLSHSDGETSRMIRGPQPETIREYELQILDGESAHTVASMKGNYQRKRIHRFEPLTASGVRLTAHATNGVRSANLFEVRVYA